MDATHDTMGRLNHASYRIHHSKFAAQHSFVTATAKTAGVPWTVIECVYDYMGRRVSRKQTDKDSGGNTTATTENHYRYDGWNCIARTNAGWTDAIYYTWGIDLSGAEQGAGGVGGLLGIKQEKTSGTHRSSPCYDGNGNVVAYVDTSGNILTRYEYDPFGNLIRSGGAVNGEKELYLFSTKPVDPVSGLYDYGYRYYDPITGRFISRDPIEEEGGVNLYGFVYNAPLNWFDFLGWNPRNKDGSKKDPGQQYEEIQKQQNDNRKKGDSDSIHNIEKSKQRDRRELEDEADRELRRRRGECVEDDDVDFEEFERWREEQARKELEKAYEEYQKKEKSGRILDPNDLNDPVLSRLKKAVEAYERIKREAQRRAKKKIRDNIGKIPGGKKINDTVDKVKKEIDKQKNNLPKVPGTPKNPWKKIQM